MYINQAKEVFGFGSNTKGQMGLEENNGHDIPLPIKIPNLVNIKVVNCGSWHCLALDNNF